MSQLEFNESLNVRSVAKYFNPVIKKSNFSDDVKVVFTDGATIDLAGFQILFSMKKELENNNKTLTIEGLPDTILEYFNLNQ